MGIDSDAILERSWVEHREPTTSNVDEPLWVAEDPESDCLAVGSVRAEAEGNLIAVVAEYRQGEERSPLLKLKGETVPRPTAAGSSLFDRF
ncbi:hypothetical protein [Halorhabdus amylolytica]|uniref:hypothetical protein n=1 Tax=Halorhabdus amylolytica TaxID=2559573 RepID=UPI0010AA5BEF|nr:hypothetical protein [Halorhabdus amylolytica]